MTSLYILSGDQHLGENKRRFPTANNSRNRNLGPPSQLREALQEKISSRQVEAAMPHTQLVNLELLPARSSVTIITKSKGTDKVDRKRLS